MAERLLELPTIECAGSPRELGRAHGETLRASIQAFGHGRLQALADYVTRRGHSGVDGFVEAGTRCFELAERWDPDGSEEHRGIAEGANVDPGWLYAIANLSDLRDVLLLSEAPDGEGCSAVIVPAERSRELGVVAAQTWDLGPADIEFVVAVHRKPISGPESWSVTCAGCLTLIGMNQAGVAVGTTNIKTRGSRIGVGYLSLLHRMIGQSTIEAAASVLRSAPRAAAHTYWIATAERALELECSSTFCFERVLDHAPLLRTNHCFSDRLRAIEGEAPSASSRRRLARLSELIDGRQIGVDDLRQVFADRRDGIDAISRHPEDRQPTATNACVVCVPGMRRIVACRGPSERGLWTEFVFTSS